MVHRGINKLHNSKGFGSHKTRWEITWHYKMVFMGGGRVGGEHDLSSSISWCSVLHIPGTLLLCQMLSFRTRAISGEPAVHVKQKICSLSKWIFWVKCMPSINLWSLPFCCTSALIWKKCWRKFSAAFSPQLKESWSAATLRPKRSEQLACKCVIM